MLNDIPGVRCAMPKGAFYVFPNVEGACRALGILDAYVAMPQPARTRTSPSGLLQRFLLERYGVATMDRNSFGRIGADGEHYLRLSIASAMERLEEGVRRIGQACADKVGCSDFLSEMQAEATLAGRS
jgi:aspartate aminotransferase